MLLRMVFIMKPKTCKSCKQKFTPVRPLQACCGINCAIAHANKLKLKNNALEARKTRKACICLNLPTNQKRGLQF